MSPPPSPRPDGLAPKGRTSKPDAFTVAVRPILLRPPQAAGALGMSEDSFNRLVRPFVKSLRRHRMKLYPVAELERWAAENVTAVLGDDD